jgi:molecular chaperone GrpE
MSERAGSPESGPDRQPSPPFARPGESAGRPAPGDSENSHGETGSRRPAEPGGTAGQPASADQAASTGELEARIAELQDLRLRALADLDNLRKQCASQVAQARAETQRQVAAQFLPVVDNLERALAHAQADPGSIIEGIGAVRDQAMSVLAQLGFPRRDDLGAPFDPARHEAVASRPDPAAPAGSVVEVVRPAYGDPDRQLRPAQVVVAKAD